MCASFSILLKLLKDARPRQARSCLKRCVQTGENTKIKKYGATILLPQTKLPNWFSNKKRVDMDKYLLEKCGFSELYSWQRENLAGPDFILHDGPPYANGALHMGHALNKILKDITIRNKVIRGQRVHYVPGWDCHGLPIELKALDNSTSDVKNLTPLQIRQQARKYAKNAVAQQREVFASWGIMADWKESGCYYTYEPSYMTNQLHQFINLYEKGIIYRDLKSVYWSPSSRTALAESELEYKSHESKCATVRFHVSELPPALKTYEGRTVYALTWTTTPWTLIANQALAYAADGKYCLAEDEGKNLYIVAEALLSNVTQKIGALKPLVTVKGSELNGARYLQPITGISSPFLSGTHVTTTMGTGLVHTAPAHGKEDFLLGLEHKIPILAIVDEEGRYTVDAGTKFCGLKVLNEGVDTVLEHIGHNVLHIENIIHDYPYDWRTNKPVIMRASQQWFFDTNSVKDKALNSLASLQIYSQRDAAFNALRSQLERRPYWCISRQRAWGTPIPVLYLKSSGNVITSRDLVERQCHLIEKYGPDCWWELPMEKLVGKKLLEELKVDISDLEKGLDIMDIWFDSGISWSAVLPEGKADLYLEGMDQFNGWFQSSLLTSIALQDSPPYKGLFVHGFTVDERARKMSKSLGNVVDPVEITKGGNDFNKKPAYGVDVLRWWVACHGCQQSQVTLGAHKFLESKESLQKIRIVLRFLLGVLHPYSINNTIEPRYLFLDKYMLHQLYHYNKKIQNLYDNYQYHFVCQTIINFVTNDLSSMYCYMIKDRIYCSEMTSPYRAGTLDVVDEVLTVVTRTIAPIVPHLAEEIWLHHPENLSSVPLFRTGHKLPESWYQPQVADVVNAVLEVKAVLNKLIQTRTWEVAATVTVNADKYALLSVLQKEEQSSTSEICDILQVSSVTLIQKDDCEDIHVDVKPIEKSLCERCRRHPESQPGVPCVRCIQVLNTIAM